MNVSPLPAAPFRPAGRAGPAGPAPAVEDPAAEPLRRRLDEVRARIRLLRVTAGLGRLVTCAVAALVLAYVLDRWLVLPLGVRGLFLAVGAVLLLRLVALRLFRPLFRGPDRLDAARMVERALPALEGRVISALQLGGGPPGSLPGAVLGQAVETCRARDLREVLLPRPSLRELWRAGGALVVLVALVLLARPHTDVFARRWMLQDVSWPRDTRLALELPPSGAGHVVLEDGTVVAARGGVLEATAHVEGRAPERVELVVDGDRGTRATAMLRLSDGSWSGRIGIERGDASVALRGGDDDGADTRRTLRVIEPPRLDAPQFVLEPPAYLGEPARTVGGEGLAVPEGTRITVRGTPQGAVEGGTLRLAAAGQLIPLERDERVDPPLLQGSFVAVESDSLALVLVGEYGLATPDPSQHALVVHKDRPPTLRVFLPARSDVKVTPKAVLAFAAIAEDDHGIAEVVLESGLEPGPGAGTGAESVRRVALTQDAARPGHHRLLLDLQQQPLTDTLDYRLVARDTRELPGGRGPQSAQADGRRVDVAEASEVQRLLADRQLRLKEAFRGIRDRQASGLEAVGVLAADPPRADDPELVAAVVAQQQVTTRLTREVRELCAILDETIWNRLDAGPGAVGVLERRMEEWRSAPVDVGFLPAPWRALAADYAAGRFGRLDVVGRLLDMAALGLELEQDRSPLAQQLLAEARAAPDAAGLQRARAAQAEVVAGLDQLLGRMDEWEDFQEVLRLVQSLIDDQRTLRTRTQSALSGGRESP
jgi:hypothetical protein